VHFVGFYDKNISDALSFECQIQYISFVVNYGLSLVRHRDL